MRRSTVLSLPLQLVFSAPGVNVFCVEINLAYFGPLTVTKNYFMTKT